MPEPVQFQSDSDFSAIFDEIITLGLDTHGFEKLKAINLLENMLIDISAKTASASPSKDRLEYLLEYLADYKNFPADYDELAASLGMGVSTMRRWFKNQTGMSMHSYALHSRIAKARSLLLETSMSIKQIAAILHFNDVFFFTRQFTKYTGMTPGKYRNTNQ